MYFTNSERNKVIYELWEKNLTIGEISSSTGIPRSTVGYYVRKFNRLSAKGKPVVFPGLSQRPGELGSYTECSSAMSVLQRKILVLMKNGHWDEVYHRLKVLKLLKEVGFLTGKDRDDFLVLLAW
jgi:transposase